MPPVHPRRALYSHTRGCWRLTTEAGVDLVDLGRRIWWPSRRALGHFLGGAGEGAVPFLALERCRVGEAPVFTVRSPVERVLLRLTGDVVTAIERTVVEQPLPVTP